MYYHISQTPWDIDVHTIGRRLNSVERQLTLIFLIVFNKTRY